MAGSAVLRTARHDLGEEHRIAREELANDVRTAGVAVAGTALAAARRTADAEGAARRRGVAGHLAGESNGRRSEEGNGLEEEDNVPEVVAGPEAAGSIRLAEAGDSGQAGTAFAAGPGTDLAEEEDIDRGEGDAGVVRILEEGALQQIRECTKIIAGSHSRP